MKNYKAQVSYTAIYKYFLQKLYPVLWSLVDSLL